MNITQESVFSSALRSFFVAVFAVFGILVGTIPVVILIGALLSSPGHVANGAPPIYLTDANGNRDPLPSTAPVILQVDIHGVIGSKKLDAELVRKQLQESREGVLKDSRVKGILLSVNSPGGTVHDSDSIYRAVKLYKEKYNVPVYAYVDGLCASGGVYIASAADKIYTSEVSLVGSIGVLMQFMNLSQTMEKVGVVSKTLIAGKNKDAMNPLRPWDAEEDENYQKLISFFYDKFTNIVTKSRPNLDKELLINEWGAKVFSAEEALEVGLIDGANLERSDVLTELVNASEIGEGEEYQVVQMQTRHWLADVLEGQSPLLTGKISLEMDLPYKYRTELANRFLYLYAP
ncbi:MAG: protease-4 [Chlamydiales bacterium]|jgi:protease-4